MQTLISIVIPSYNEAENFKKGCLDEVNTFLKKQKFTWEVILVDDGSTDQTKALLKKFVQQKKGFVFYSIPHGGKLAAVKKGVERARGKYVLFTDFDQSTPIENTTKVLEEFGKGADIVIASRYRKGAERKNDSLASLLRSQIFRFLTKVILGLPFEDTQCGFKAFKTQMGKELFSDLRVHKIKNIKKPFMGAFDVELLYLAQKRGLKIVSIPVVWHRKESKRLTFGEPWQMFLALFKIRLFDFLGRYG